MGAEYNLRRTRDVTRGPDYDGRNMDETIRLDARGCLTAAGIEAFQRADVGEAPADVARHLATCVRCQEAVLAAESLRSAGLRRTGSRPTAARTAAIVGLILLGAFVALYTMRWAFGPR
jgi:hypothetical protein